MFRNKSKKPQIRLLENQSFTEGVYFFCGKNWLITIHSTDVELVKSTRKLLEHENKKMLKDSIEALFYNILAEMIDRYEQVLTALELTMTDLEEKVLSDPAKETIGHIAILSRQLIGFRRHFWHIRDVVNFLTHMEKDQDEVKYIQMAYDNITQLIELVESYRDTINSVRDLYIANISLQMNDAMRVLTIFVAILLPLTLIVGIYGMNGLDLNNLSSLPPGFFIVLFTMIMITGMRFYLFRKKNWIVFRGKNPLPQKDSQEK